MKPDKGLSCSSVYFLRRARVDPSSLLLSFSANVGDFNGPGSTEGTWHLPPEQARPEDFASQPHPGPVTGALSLFIPSFKAEMMGYSSYYLRLDQHGNTSAFCSSQNKQAKLLHRKPSHRTLVKI